MNYISCIKLVSFINCHDKDAQSHNPQIYNTGRQGSLKVENFLAKNCLLPHHGQLPISFRNTTTHRLSNACHLLRQALMTIKHREPEWAK
jgi:hypothetical protein